MHHELKPHPATPCDAVSRIRVAIARAGGTLRLTYLVTGEIDDVLMPRKAPSGRADELWKHTCFEAFVRRQGEAAYREFNFSPSTAWAAYQFTDVRQGMAKAGCAPPTIDTHATRGTFSLEAAFEFETAADDACRLALSAVIEETNGNTSYWALAHPSGKPDFHHPDSFVLELPRASAP